MYRNIYLKTFTGVAQINLKVYTGISASFSYQCRDYNLMYWYIQACIHSPTMYSDHANCNYPVFSALGSVR